mmetsp:Transcript_79555/g.223560  ORF Transcript_79555/g.223560 Transcript_79555/m.223560 type:complete len:248 (-) Transcript_79555:1264-2007(-)
MLSTAIAGWKKSNRRAVRQGSLRRRLPTMHPASDVLERMVSRHGRICAGHFCAPVVAHLLEVLDGRGAMLDQAHLHVQILAPSLPIHGLALIPDPRVDGDGRLGEGLHGTEELDAIHWAVLYEHRNPRMWREVPPHAGGEEDAIGVHLDDPVVARHLPAGEEGVPSQDERRGVEERARRLPSMEVAQARPFHVVEPRVLRLATRVYADGHRDHTDDVVVVALENANLPLVLLRNQWYFALCHHREAI